MSGVQDYNSGFEKKINQKLIEHPELIGFANYIDGINSITTKYNYLNYVINFLKMTNKQTKDLNFDDYTSFLVTLNNTTPSYQRAVYFGLKRFSEYLAFSSKNSLNPMQNIKPPKNIESIETKEKRAKGFLTKKEVANTIKAVKKGAGNKRAIAVQRKWKERDLAIIYIFLSTGMRCSALYKLDLNNINWDESSIVVIDKGSKIHKYILSDETMKIIKDWIDKRIVILNNDNSQEALFISSQKNRLGISSISDIVQKYTAEIKGKHITPHKLRATFGTHLYNETRDIKFVQDQMGHSNPQITEIYIRGNQDADRKKAADIMSKFLGN